MRVEDHDACVPPCCLRCFRCEVALADDSAPYAESDFPRVEKIDTHVHLYGELPVFMAACEGR